MSRAFKAFILFVLVGLIAAACGGDETSTSTSTEALPGNTDTAAAPVTTTVAPAGDATTTTKVAAGGEGEHLSDFIPGFFNFSDPSASEAEFRRQEQQIQESVAQCMAAEGFEYLPYIPGDDLFFGIGGDPAEFAATYGFGVSTFVAIEDQFFGNPDDDPNMAITSAMDEAELDEYFAILYGEYPEIDFENMTDDEIEAAFAAFEATGCYAVAQEEVFGSLDFFLDFGDELDDLFSRVEADPRIVAAEADWAGCMADKGYTFADQEEIFEYLQEQVDQVVTYPDPFADSNIPEPDFASMTEEEVEAFFAAQESLYAPQYDDDELAELNAEEIAIALADNECSEDSFELFEEVLGEYEAEWIAENRDALEQYRQDS